MQKLISRSQIGLTVRKKVKKYRRKNEIMDEKVVLM